MIFFLIAGTATPVLLLTSPGTFGLTCLITVWTLAATAVMVHLKWMSAPELVVGAVFLGLGWVAALALPGLWIHAGVAPAALVLAGGLLYTAGAVCTAAGGPIRVRQSSATTRSSTPSYASPRRASTSRSPSWSLTRASVRYTSSSDSRRTAATISRPFEASASKRIDVSPDDNPALVRRRSV